MELMSKRKHKSYLDKEKTKDIHEQDIDYQKRVIETYMDLASKRDNWVVIDCYDPKKKEMWDLGLGVGRKKIFDVRRSYSDRFFIEHFLTERLVDDLNLYLYEGRQESEEIKYVITDRDWRRIKQLLVSHLSTFDIPLILVEEGDYKGKRELYLVHAFDGTALDNVSLAVGPGEFVAVVGPSGSGKSTLLRVLIGFETPEEGSVRYDGQELLSLDVLAVRRQLGVVLQGGAPEAGTIFENIAGGLALGLEEAWAAAEDAGLAADIRAMPMGMHTLVSVGGSNLSGGQRQRLLIARALARKPRVLLFDEATSALDNRTQALVGESLERLKVTRLVVAHRLSTIRRADRIYVLERGRVVEQGPYEQLVARDGPFRRLMQGQLMQGQLG